MSLKVVGRENAK